MQQVGPYRLVERLGATASSAVWRGERDAGQARVEVAAVKLLRGVGAVERCEREVAILSRLRGHPRIVALLDAGRDEAVGPWLAMELLGGSLRQLCGPRPVAPEVVCRVVRQVAEALVAVHGSGFLHLDVKPTNVLLDRLDGRFECRLIDFGIAQPIGEAVPASPARSARYCAPELLDPALGPAGPSSDLYSLGMVAVELALGRDLLRRQIPAVFGAAATDLAEPGEAAKWMFWHTSRQPRHRIAPVVALVPGFPRGLCGILGELLEKDAARRTIGSAADLLVRLNDPG